eukprot:1454602-Rhodomonas_salina.5
MTYTVREQDGNVSYALTEGTVPASTCSKLTSVPAHPPPHSSASAPLNQHTSHLKPRPRAKPAVLAPRHHAPRNALDPPTRTLREAGHRNGRPTMTVIALPPRLASTLDGGHVVSVVERRPEVVAHAGEIVRSPLLRCWRRPAASVPLRHLPAPISERGARMGATEEQDGSAAGWSAVPTQLLSAE